MSNVATITPPTGKAVATYEAPQFLVPKGFQEVEILAQKLCNANWVPKSYIKNGRPDQAMVEVGIMHGLEVGLRPMAALQSIAVINGTPSLWGDGMLALVEASGLMEDISETIEPGKGGDDHAAVCVAKRRGRATPAIVRFTVGNAKKAGLWGKQGPWTQYPDRMLQLRARAFALRAAFSDVLKGLQMAEEVMDAQQDAPAFNAPPRPSREAYVGATVDGQANAVDAEIIEDNEFDAALFIEGVKREISAATTVDAIIAITRRNADEASKYLTDEQRADLRAFITGAKAALTPEIETGYEEIHDLAVSFRARIAAAETVAQLNDIGDSPDFIPAADYDEQLEPLMAKRRAEVAK